MLKNSFVEHDITNRISNLGRRVRRTGFSVLNSSTVLFFYATVNSSQPRAIIESFHVIERGALYNEKGRRRQTSPFIFSW